MTVLYCHCQVNNRAEEDVPIKPLVMLPGQGGEVTGVAWCPSQLSKVKKEISSMVCVLLECLFYMMYIPLFTHTIRLTRYTL